MNISDTMASVRWMFEKHMKRYEGQTDVPICLHNGPDRDPPKPAMVITADFAISVLEKHRAGQTAKSIAKELGGNEMTVGNIIRRRRGYKTMPDTNKGIIQWFKNRKK